MLCVPARVLYVTMFVSLCLSLSLCLGEGVTEASCHEGGRRPDTAETGVGELTCLGLLSTGQWTQ